MSDLVALGDLLDGMVGDDHGFNEVEWAVAEIERLRDSIKTVCNERDQWMEQRNKELLRADAANKRIEELEHPRFDICPTCGRRGRDHHSTDEQIAAAVEYAEETGCWIALNKLNIFRCEYPGCDRGMIQEQVSNDPGDPFIQEPCPDCNGKGYEVRK